MDRATRRRSDSAVRSDPVVQNANEPWRESGRLGGALLLLPIGVASALVTSCVYSFVATAMPLIGYFTALLVVGFGAATAVPLRWAGLWFRVRSVAAMRIVGVITGLVAIWMAWAFFFWRLVRDEPGAAHLSLFDWATSPGLVVDVMRAVAEHGSFTIGSLVRPSAGGVTVRGAFLWILWASEALLVVIPCIVVAPMGVRDRPFCETCGQWMKFDENVPFLTSATAKAVRDRGLAGITDPVRPRPSAEWCWLLSTWRCPTCDAGLFRIDRAYDFVENSLASIDWSKRRRQKLDRIVPLSWMRGDDRAHVERIADESRQRMG